MHPNEFDDEAAAAQDARAGHARPALEWANPGGATLTREELATMTAGYYGMVAQLDHAIGRVLDTLDERGLADDTLVIVTTDHGEFLGEHQMIFKGPFGYDSLLRVPLLVRGPGVDAGAVVDDPGRHDRPRADDARRPRASTCPTGWKAGRCATCRASTCSPRTTSTSCVRIPLRTLTTTRYKLHRYLERPFGELYDLQEDPGELVNRCDDPAYASVEVRSPRAARRRDEPRRAQGTVGRPRRLTPPDAAARVRVPLARISRCGGWAIGWASCRSWS